MADKTKTYRFVGGHADTLANGRPVEPGEFVDLTDDEIREPFNEMLIADERLIGTDEASEHQANLADRRVDRRVSEDTNDGKES